MLKMSTDVHKDKFFEQCRLAHYRTQQRRLRARGLQGVAVITLPRRCDQPQPVKIDPYISSNWRIACELYCQRDDDQWRCPQGPSRSHQPVPLQPPPFGLQSHPPHRKPGSTSCSGMHQVGGLAGSREKLPRPTSPVRRSVSAAPLVPSPPAGSHSQ